jgi:hypothetical protein
MALTSTLHNAEGKNKKTKKEGGVWGIKKQNIADQRKNTREGQVGFEKAPHLKDCTKSFRELQKLNSKRFVLIAQTSGPH